MISLCSVKHYCKNYTEIENYEEAISDNDNVWICHHKLEAFFSSKELKNIGRYYNLSPRELVFCRNNKEHHIWPHIAYKGCNKGRKPWNKGKKGLQTRSEEVRKQSVETRRKNGTLKRTEETIAKMKQFRWFTNGETSVKAIECPPGFRPGRFYHRSH